MGRYKNIVVDKKELIKDNIDVDDFKSEEVLKIFKQMKNLINGKNLLGLCASQIGYHYNIIMIKDEEGIKTFVNPVIGLDYNLDIKSNGIHIVIENNVSFPNRSFINVRRNDIRLKYKNEVGIENIVILKDIYSDVFQQLFDLMNGITLDTFGLELTQEEQD